MTTIASSAFSSSPYVYNLEIPNSVTTIEADAFTGSGIGTVTIPKSVTTIGSQSSWTPDVIYGYTGSEAERFANEYGYIFESIGGEKEDPPKKPGPNDQDPGGDNGNDGSNGSNGGSSGSGTGTGGNTNTNTGTSTGTGGSGVRTVNSVSRNLGTARVQSGTPKTGIAFDARYVLCAGIFLAGVCLVITKKKKSMKI